jgi:hypothetical protein
VECMKTELQVLELRICPAKFNVSWTIKILKIFPQVVARKRPTFSVWQIFSCSLNVETAAASSEKYWKQSVFPILLTRRLILSVSISDSLHEHNDCKYNTIDYYYTALQ